MRPPTILRQASTPPPPGPLSVSRTRVRNQRRTTRPCPRVLRRFTYGSSAWLCPRLHHRPATPTPGRRPPGRRLLPGVHRDRQRRPHRPARLEQLLDQLRPGDTLVVWKLDPLGRSLRHLVDTVAGLADRGVGFRSLQEAIDTTTPAASSSSTCSPPWPSSNATSSANAPPPGWPPPGPAAAT